MHPASDYAPEPDTEEVVLTRWEKIKKWIEIAIATKKLATFVWTLIFGVTGTMAVGQITRTNPLRDTAIEIGIIEPDVIATVEDETVAEPIQIPGPPGPAGPRGATGPPGKDGTITTVLTPELKAAIAIEVKQLLPNDHMRLH